MRNYILSDTGEPVIEPDILVWAKWFESATNRVLALSHVGPIRISTVFLGTDHSFSGTGPAVLYATMTFGEPADSLQRRYISREAALLGHADVVAEVAADIARLK
jgi:hypothetical protein